MNPNEVNQLGTKRRIGEIKRYYTFDRRETLADRQFKSSMNTAGKYYQINDSLERFPSIAAALLKYKKHEWIVIGFEYNKNVFLIWCNKGFDNSSVSIGLSLQAILKTSSDRKVTSILSLHNHPNPNPQYYRMNYPSEIDKTHANQWSEVLTKNGINLIAFVCERGIPYEYYRSISNDFLPLNNFIIQINEINGKSKYNNIKMHIERLI